MTGVGYNCDSGQPGDNPDEDQQPKPPSPLLRWWNRALDVIASPHAPHWVIAVLTGVLALFAWRAWDEAKNNTRQLESQIIEMRRESRPWVTMDSAIKIIKPLTFDISGAHVEFVGSLRNGGRSVAQKVTTLNSRLMIQNLLPEGVRIIPAQIGAVIAQAVGSDFKCDKRVAGQFTGLLGELLLPGGVSEWRPGRITVSPSMIPASKSGMTGAWMTVCIMYRDDANDLHATPILLTFTTEDGRDTFLPSGEIKGTFKVIGGIAPPY